MTGIVLVTHNGLGEIMRHQVETIVGHPVRLTTVAIADQVDPELALVDVTAALAMGADEQGVIVISDLPGATPHNLASKAAAQHDAPLVSGLNLPMLLKVVNHAEQPPLELAKLALTGGQQGMAHR